MYISLTPITSIILFQLQQIHQHQLIWLVAVLQQHHLIIHHHPNMKSRILEVVLAICHALDIVQVAQVQVVAAYHLLHQLNFPVL